MFRKLHMCIQIKGGRSNDPKGNLLLRNWGDGIKKCEKYKLRKNRALRKNLRKKSQQQT